RNRKLSFERLRHGMWFENLAEHCGQDGERDDGGDSIAEEVAQNRDRRPRQQPHIKSPRWKVISRGEHQTANGVVSTEAKGHCDQCAPRMSDHHRVPSPDPFFRAFTKRAAWALGVQMRERGRWLCPNPGRSKHKTR